MRITSTLHGLSILAAILGTPLAALAQHASQPSAAKAGPLVVEAPWARATPGGAKVGGGYMRITNTGKEPDRLVGGTAPVAGRLEVHEMSQDGDVMRMRALANGLEIKPGETIELKPGGFHIMFMDLREPLKAGEGVKGTLRFEKAGTIEVEFRVAPVGSAGPEAGAHGAGHGSGHGH